MAEGASAETAWAEALGAPGASETVQEHTHMHGHPGAVRHVHPHTHKTGVDSHAGEKTEVPHRHGHAEANPGSSLAAAHLLVAPSKAPELDPRRPDRGAAGHL